MNRKEAAELLPIIKAFSEGRVIQMKTVDKGWQDIYFASFDSNPKEYRIKPEPKYRPFKDAEECWQEMLKHQPFGWVTCQCAFFHIIYIEDKLIGYGSACGTILHSKFNDVLKSFTFADGLPFGVEEEK